MELPKFDRYQATGVLGEGSMGTVYRGFDPRLKREVAIKTVKPEIVRQDPGLEARFVREAEVVAALRHPAIVQIHDFGGDYLVMELLQGQELRTLLRTGRKFSPSEIAFILHQLADALDYAHALGVVHRDLKPANLFIEAGNRPKLTDFGIAKFQDATIEGLTATGKVLGTPAYMSPEQVEGHPLDGRSDQFSLGVVAYQLLAGKTPFAAESVTATINRIVNAPPPPLREFQPELPPALDAVFGKVLAKAPAGRYRDCRAFAAAFARAAGIVTPAGGWAPLAVPDDERTSGGTRPVSVPQSAVTVERRTARYIGAGAAAGVISLLLFVGVRRIAGPVDDPGGGQTAPARAVASEVTVASPASSAAPGGVDPGDATESDPAPPGAESPSAPAELNAPEGVPADPSPASATTPVESAASESEPPAPESAPRLIPPPSAPQTAGRLEQELSGAPPPGSAPAGVPPVPSKSAPASGPDAPARSAVAPPASPPAPPKPASRPALPHSGIVTPERAGRSPRDAAPRPAAKAPAKPAPRPAPKSTPGASERRTARPAPKSAPGTKPAPPAGATRRPAKPASAPGSAPRKTPVHPPSGTRKPAPPRTPATGSSAPAR